MLGLFRNNQITTLLLLAIYATLLRIPLLAGWAPAPASAPDLLPGILYGLIPDVFTEQGIWSMLAALLMVLVQGVWVYFLVDKYRLMDDRTWLPALGYMIAVGCIPQALYLSAPLIGVTFLLPVLMKAFSLYKKPLVTATSFDIGLWLAVGTLFYPPIFLLLLPVLFLIRSLRTYKLHERLILMAGFFVPYFLSWTWLFWKNQTAVFWRSIKAGLQFSVGVDLPAAMQDRVALGLLGFLVLIILLNIPSFYHKRLMQVQKYISGLFWLMLACGVAMLFFRQPFQWQYLLAAPSIGIFIGLTLNDLRSRVLAEVLHLVLLAGIFFVQFYPFLF